MVTATLKTETPPSPVAAPAAAAVDRPREQPLLPWPPTWGVAGRLAMGRATAAAGFAWAKS